MPDVTIRYKGDSRDADSATQKIRRGFKDADGDARKASAGFGAVTKSLLGMAAGAVAFGAIVKGAKFAVSAASDLSEQINKTGVVFGKASGDVIAFSKTTANALGISQRAALEAAGTFGNMLVPMGFAREEAAKMSTRMVELAADMASFNNADPSQVLEALRSGLAGETEPLRKFGIFLNDARLKAEAMALGIYNGKGALDAAAKAQATYSIILKDSADAQGDFGRTSDSLANQQRILKAQIEEVAAAIGAKFLPLVTRAINAMTEWLGNPQHKAMLESIASTIAGALTNAIQGFVALVVAHKDDLKNLFESAVGVIATIGPAIKSVAGFLLDLSGAIGDQKAQVATLLVAWVAWKTGAITAAAQVAVANVAAANTTAAAWRAALVATGWGALAVAAGIAIGLIISHWGRIKKFFEDWKGALRAVGTLMAEIGKGMALVVLGPFLAAIDGMLRAIEAVVRQANKLPIIGRAIPDGLADGIKRLRETVEDFMIPDVGKVKAAFAAAGSDAAGAYNQAFAAAINANPLPMPGMPGITGAGSGANLPKGVISPVPAGSNPTIGPVHQTAGMGGPAPAIDLSVAAGTPVLAPEDGVCSAAGGTDPAKGNQDAENNVGGYHLKFVGASGTTYWMTHLARVFPGKKRKGEAIGVVASIGPGPNGAKAIGEHVHVAIIGGTNQDALDLAKATQGFLVGNVPATPGSTTTTPSPTPTPTPTPTTTPTPKVTVEKPEPADVAEVAKTTGLINFIGKHIEDAVEATKPKLTASLKSLRALVKEALKDGIITDEELAKIRSQAEKLNDQLGRSIRTEQIRDSLLGAREKISELVAGGFITPAAAEKMRASIAKIAAMIREATSPDSPGGINITAGELAAIEKRWASVSEKIQKGVADAAAAAAGVAKVKAAFRTAMKDGVLSDAEIEGFLKGLDGLKGKVAAKIRNAAQAVLDARGTFKAAWDNFVGYALQAFDRATAALRKTITVKVKVEGTVEFDFKEGDLTPSEQEIYDAEKRRGEAEFKARKEAAAEKLRLAKETGEGLAEAQREWDDIMYEEWKAGKEAQAALERQAATDALAIAQQDFDDRAAVRRIAFEKELGDIGAQMASGKLTYDQGLDEIQKLFAKYKVPFDEQSGALGTALQSALLAAFGAIEVAMNNLASAIASLVKALGGQVAEAESLSARAQKAYKEARDAQIQNANENRPGTGNVPVDMGVDSSVPPVPVPGSTGPQELAVGSSPASDTNPVPVAITNPDELPGNPTGPGQQEFARGGIARARNGLIAGTYTPMDSLLTRVSPGEMILNPKQQAVLFALANGRGGGRGRLDPPVLHMHWPRFVGDRRDLMREVRAGIESVFRSSGGFGW